jgi:flagellar hook-associated protein 2
MAVSSTNGISFSGLSSGLDTDSIISQLVNIEKAPIQRMTAQQKTLRDRAELYSQFATKITGIASAGNQLTTLGTFSAISASSSDNAVAAVTVDPGATLAGSFNLTVSKLAQSQKLSSSAQTSATAGLGYTGSFNVNGKAVTVEATDSITSIAQKVNGLGVGVTASVIDGGTNNAYLTFTSGTTGLTGKPQLSDLTGTILNSLGMLNGTSSIRESITNGAVGTKLTASTTALGTLMGATGLTDQTVQINGVSVTLNLQTDSLQGVADKINAASTGATASVVSITESGTTKYRLEIKNPSSTPTFTDSGNTLSALGILQNGAANSLVEAQDAAYTIDGVSLTSSTNSIKGVVPGATLTLIKANVTTPEKSTISLTSDTDTISNRVQSFITSFNETAAFIDQYSQFDEKSFATGPLFGDSTVRQFLSTFTVSLFDNVAGATGDYKNAASIGMRLNSKGTIDFDTSVFKTALQKDPEGVRKIFQNSGSSANSALTFVSAASTAKPSGTTPYGIDITQVATKTNYLAATTKTGPNTVSEVLTFSGALMSSTNYALNIDVGASLSDIVSKINSDSRLRDLVSASDNGGKLQVESKRFGTSGRFNLVSNQSPLGSNSGVGFSAGSLVDGLDIAGTIAGQAATGSGQFLTGATGNSVANGLQIQYTGLTTGVVGSMSYVRGVSGSINESLKTFTDSLNGLAVAGQDVYKKQADDLQKEIDRINIRAKQKGDDLKAKFIAMESRMNTLKSQGSALSQLFASANSSN